MSKKKKPEIIDLPEGKLDEIKSQLMSVSMPDDNKNIVLTILSTYAWLTRQLSSTKLTIRRLKRLFGFTTERHHNKNKDQDTPTSGEKDNTLPPVSEEDQKTTEQTIPEKKSPNGTQIKTTDV